VHYGHACVCQLRVRFFQANQSFDHLTGLYTDRGRSGSPRGGYSALTAGEAFFRVSTSREEMSLLSNDGPSLVIYSRPLKTATEMIDTVLRIWLNSVTPSCGERHEELI
jgi:hypothetical protein